MYVLGSKWNIADTWGKLMNFVWAGSEKKETIGLELEALRWFR